MFDLTSNRFWGETVILDQPIGFLCGAGRVYLSETSCHSRSQMHADSFILQSN